MTTSDPLTPPIPKTAYKLAIGTNFKLTFGAALVLECFNSHEEGLVWPKTPDNFVFYSVLISDFSSDEPELLFMIEEDLFAVSDMLGPSVSTWTKQDTQHVMSILRSQSRSIQKALDLRKAYDHDSYRKKQINPAYFGTVSVTKG